MKKFLLLIAATAFALLTTACTDSSGYTYETVKNDPLKTRIYTLDNGLKVYMSVNKAEPRIETYIAVKVGGKNDPSETTGLAHYFEHLMFKGTQQFGTSNYEAEKPLLDQIEQLFEVYRKTTDDAERAAIYRQIDSISYEASKYAIPNEYDKLMSAIGALETNANTSMDRTVYIENIPSNQIENWARIQADRFKNVVIRGFHTELETIYEEKNMSLTDDNRKVYTTIGEVLYPNHPYGKQSVLGTQEHLKNPSITNVKNYHTQYYVPNNMAILLSGDFDPDQMIATIDKYFGDMQPNENIPQLAFEPEAPITKPIVKEVYGPDAANVTLAWRTDNAASDDAEYLLLASRILYNGQAGMIDLDLMQQQKVLDAFSYPDQRADYGALVLQGLPKAGQTLDEVRDLLLAEVAKLLNGVWLNLSFWYKREERTSLAIVVTFVGLIFTIGCSLSFIPRWGYYGAAWARLVSEAAMVAVSFWLNRRFYPMPYQTGRILGYVALALVLYGVSVVVDDQVAPAVPRYACYAALLLLYFYYAVRREKIDLRALVRSAMHRGHK